MHKLILTYDVYGEVNVIFFLILFCKKHSSKTLSKYALRVWQSIKLSAVHFQM